MNEPSVLDGLRQAVKAAETRILALRLLHESAVQDWRTARASMTTAERAIRSALAEYYLSDAPFVGDRMRDVLEKAGFRLKGYGPPQSKETP
jgi:hypothetical protein